MNGPDCTLVDLLIVVFLTPFLILGMDNAAEALWNAIERFLEERKQRKQRKQRRRRNK